MQVTSRGNLIPWSRGSKPCERTHHRWSRRMTTCWARREGRMRCWNLLTYKSRRRFARRISWRKRRCVCRSWVRMWRGSGVRPWAGWKPGWRGIRNKFWSCWKMIMSISNNWPIKMWGMLAMGTLVIKIIPTLWKANLMYKTALLTCSLARRKLIGPKDYELNSKKWVSPLIKPGFLYFSIMDLKHSLHKNYNIFIILFW